MDIYVARQPIFTTKRQIFGYELLFRLGLENAFPDIDGNVATSSVLSNTFFSFELGKILANKPGLINFTRELLLQRTPLLFPKKHIIIEVLEDIEPTDQIIEALTEINSKGYKIALDDFVYHEKFQPMMALCRLIKFDLMATPLDTLNDIVADIKENYAITLLAEKVETYEEFELAKEMGFKLFQGYFFSKPEILTQKDISPGQIVKLKLIEQVNREHPDLDEIQTLIKNDLSVSYKLLKFINSAYFNRSVPINTVKDAITYMGLDELKKFINVVAVSDLNETKPNELIRTSVIHASLCEQLGTILNTHFTADELFTIGLFSMMDAMLDRDMETVLSEIALSDTIKKALLGKDKEYNQIVKIVTSYEKGEWNNPVYKKLSGTLVEQKLPEFYFEALTMADTFLE
jgi:c-di-GMP-related signal transduction protein